MGVQNELNDWVECVAGGDRDKADSADNTLTIDVVGHEKGRNVGFNIGVCENDSIFAYI